MFIVGCEKDNSNDIVDDQEQKEIEVETGDVASLGYNTTFVKGKVINVGERECTVGICWSLNSEPTIAGDTVICNLNSLGEFQVELKNLEPQKLNYYSAFIITEEVIIYGSVKEFTTKIDPLNEQLVLYFPFNGNTEDESENSFDATNYGATLASDRFGNANSAFYFDGIDDYINCGNEMNFSNTNLSFSFWFKAQEQDDFAYIMERYNKYDGNIYGINFYISTQSNLVATCINSETIDLYYAKTSNINMEDDNWRYVTFVRESGAWFLWVDATPIIGFVQSITDVTNIGDLVIGANINDTDGYGNPFKGAIDEIRVYNKSLQNEDIQRLYHEGGWNE